MTEGLIPKETVRALRGCIFHWKCKLTIAALTLGWVAFLTCHVVCRIPHNNKFVHIGWSSLYLSVPALLLLALTLARAILVQPRFSTNSEFVKKSGNFV